MKSIENPFKNLLKISFSFFFNINVSSGKIQKKSDFQMEEGDDTEEKANKRKQDLEDLDSHKSKLEQISSFQKTLFIECLLVSFFGIIWK